MPRLPAAAALGLVLATACSDGRAHARATCVLVDVSGTYDDQRPEVARILQGAEREELRYLMDRFNKTIQVKPQQNYHQEQFDIYGRQDRVEQGRERDRGERERGERDRGRGREPRGGRRPEETDAPPAAAKDDG